MARGKEVLCVAICDCCSRSDSCKQTTATGGSSLRGGHDCLREHGLAYDYASDVNISIQVSTCEILGQLALKRMETVSALSPSVLPDSALPRSHILRS